MDSDKGEYQFIKNERDWENFLKREKIRDYSKIPVPRAKIRGVYRVAFIFLRVYIAFMLVLVLLGFLHIL
jgi:hypothetical protein